MIEIFGPSYRYNGERLTEPEIIYIHDHHYDEENQCFHIKQLMETSICDPQKHLLVFDHINHEDQLAQYNHVSLPVFQAAELERFVEQKITPDWTQKTCTFNFMINKPRLHREFLLMMIEHFGLTNYSYSLPWKFTRFSCDTLKSQMKNTDYHVMVDQARGDIPGTNYVFGPEVALDQGVKNGNFSNPETYNYLLKHTVFEPSCISLITEPLCFERETLHTEKTLMAMYGGTFPIWVGGWRLADYARSIGFDVFDDIIDHSYQALADPWDRCYYAVKNNLELLKDFGRAKLLIEQNQPRLKRNVEVLETNPFFADVLSKIEQYPETTRSVLIRISRKYQHGHVKNNPSPIESLLGNNLGDTGKVYDLSYVKLKG
jgi:hypothetical protein